MPRQESPEYSNVTGGDGQITPRKVYEILEKSNGTNQTDQKSVKRRRIFSNKVTCLSMRGDSIMQSNLTYYLQTFIDEK